MLVGSHSLFCHIVITSLTLRTVVGTAKALKTVLIASSTFLLWVYKKSWLALKAGDIVAYNTERWTDTTQVTLLIVSGQTRLT
jgi:hypothetical protein